jgi:hypothetical protein
MIVRDNDVIVRRKGHLLIFDSKDPGIFHERNASNQVMMYGKPNYSRFIDCQKNIFALVKMSKPTNPDIKDKAYLHIVHILEHPTCRPTTKSRETTIVNALEKNISQLLTGKYCKSKNLFSQRHHQAKEGNCGLKADTVRAPGAFRSLRSKKKLLAKK